MTLVLGLTGSIGMGKTTTADMFRALGVPVHDADAAVHDLYRSEAVEPVGRLFPEVVIDGRIDREALGRAVIGHPERMKALEGVIHPLVRRREQAAIAAARASQVPLIVLDVPLLFETMGAERCDAVAVVSAPAEMQRARVLARPGMTETRFQQLLVRQIPDAEKRARADFVVDTGQGLDVARRQVEAIVVAMSERARAAGTPASSGRQQDP
jgi:dephospho-CoA kinase